LSSASSSASARSRWPLRRFILLWAAGIVVAFFLLAAVASEATSRLQAMTSRVRKDATSVALTSEFSRSLLSQRRDHLLWHVTRESAYLERSEEGLAHLDRSIGRLRSSVTSREEDAVVAEVEAAYAAFRAVAPESGHDNTEDVSPYTERLLRALDRLLEVNQRQMDATDAESAALNEHVDRLVAVALVILPLVIAAASWRLWTRIVEPTLELSRAAREFGAGDLASRTHIIEDDELGDVCRTFNVMADEIAARERERLDFLATVAHDLRNPLTVISGTTDLLRRTEAAVTAKRAAWFDRVMAQARRLEAMTFDLTNAVQVQTGRLTLEPVSLDLAELVREVVEDASREDEGRHTIRLKADARCPVRGDAPRLERVFANLLSNAIKYSEPGTEIRVALESRDDGNVVTVEDQGCGIGPADLRDLFTPFRRASGVRGKVRGTGLGLFSVKRIVEAHGGRLEVRSQISRGTTIEVILPADEGVISSGTSNGARHPAQK
jgi:two-component system, OmpR family, sensor histidine kinase MtrB